MCPSFIGRLENEHYQVLPPGGISLLFPYFVNLFSMDCNVILVKKSHSLWTYLIVKAREMTKMIKVAIVEDDLSSQHMLTSYLHQYEKSKEELFEIHCFTNGLAFIDNYTADYDLIFMDIEMPFMNGMEAAKKLRERDEDVALIFMTIFSQYSLFGYEVDASAFLIKPLNYDIVKNKLDRGNTTTGVLTPSKLPKMLYLFKLHN